MSAEEIADALEDVGAVSIVKSYGYGALAAMFVGGAAAGGLATFVFLKKKLDREYDDRLETEVRESVQFLVENSHLKDQVVVTDEDPDEYAERVNEGDVEEDIDPVVPEPLEKVEGERVFKDDKPPLDQLAKHNQTVQYNKILTEESYATPEVSDEPLVDPGGWDPGTDDIAVISRDIFMNNASGFEQTTLTWFQDGAVVDLADDVVDHHEILIGSNRPPFGQMSDDENIVYIRNRKIKTEYEIIQDPGKASDFIQLADAVDPVAEEEVGEELLHSLVQHYKSSERRR